MRYCLLLLELVRVALMQLLFTALQSYALMLLHKTMAGTKLAVTITTRAHASQGHRGTGGKGAPLPPLDRSRANFERPALSNQHKWLLMINSELPQLLILIQLLVIEFQTVQSG